MSPDFIKRKILLLGDASVGKTSLIRRFVVDKFSDDYITTIGTKVTKKDLRLELGNRTVDLSLMIWDVLGQKGYKGIQESAFRGARGVLLVYDLTRPETRESLGEYWIPRVRSVAGAVPMLVVGNKVDLAPSKPRAMEEVSDVGKAHGTQAFVSSAKTGENVESVFLAIGGLVIALPETAEAATEDGEEEGPLTLVSATDQIIVDFCKEFGDMESGMPLVRQQLTRAAVDINAPTKDGLRLAVEYLAEVEAGFKNADEIEANKLRRLAWIKEAR
ncbi:MAG TPA: Rab family GTPase [Thermoplasmata archaeon]|nr:Rab family GTPase [Thermoplasmata archaeon]